MLPQHIVYISIFTSIFAGYFYIKNIFLGKTKPNLVTWIVWVLAPLSVGLVQIYNGSGISAIPVFMAGFTPFVVVLVSLFKKNAYWKAENFDYICLFLAILSLAFFIFLKTGIWATIFAILADFIAFIPTFKKSWNNPETETLSSYYSGSFNSILSLVTLSMFNFNTAGFAIYLLFANLAEVVIVYMRKKIIK